MRTRRRQKLRTGSPDSGFTLIEVLVVVVVIGIVSSIVLISLNIIADDRDLQRESRRLASLLELAVDEAELQGREFGIEFVRQGYRFVEYDPLFERWAEVIGDEVLGPRRLPEDYELELYIEDRRVDLAEDPASTEDEKEEDSPLLDKYAPHGLIMSSGDVSPFDVNMIRRTDDAIVRVAVEVDGSIKVVDDEDEFD